MRISFDKIDGIIKIYDKIISEESGITDSINHNFARSELACIILYLLKKILTFYNVIILIKSVVNKNKNEHYYNIFLEKGSYKDQLNAEYF